MNERIEKLMSIICEGQNSIQCEEVENYINNLQSKIDKAINKLEKYGLVDKNGNFNAYLDTIELKELLDILKEDK